MTTSEPLPRATYSEKADALYVYLTDADVERTKALDDYRNVDFDATGGVVGVEFLEASRGLDLRDIPFRKTVEDTIRGFNFPIYA
jgi:uncharacterized protein YuzE